MADGDCREHPDFLSKQLITCLGNKRALLGPIEAAVGKIKHRLGRERISFFDLFSDHLENILTRIAVD